jgi:hypothetical protein
VYVNVENVDVGRVWDCMMCVCGIEEEWDGESVGSEALSLRFILFVMNQQSEI